MLSIIIPTLNEEKYLPRLIESIKAQSFSDYEIIVSDGGSNDNTGKIAYDNGCQFIVDSNHHSPAWQRNNGAKVAQGEILLFLDADTVLQPGFLNGVFEEFLDRQLVGAGFYIKFNPNKPSYEIFAFFYNLFCFFRQRFSPASIGAGIMAKKEGHEKISGFDPEVLLAEDYDYCDRLARYGKFRMIKNRKLLYSSRRIERDGWLAVAWQWGRMATYTVFNRRIKKDIIKYDFGKY